MACVMSSAYDRLPQAFLIFFGSDLGVCGSGDSQSCLSCLMVTMVSEVGESVATTGWLGSGSGQVLERERASDATRSNSNGAYSMTFIRCGSDKSLYRCYHPSETTCRKSVFIYSTSAPKGRVFSFICRQIVSDRILAASVGFCVFVDALRRSSRYHFAFVSWYALLGALSV